MVETAELTLESHLSCLPLQIQSGPQLEDFQVHNRRKDIWVAHLVDMSNGDVAVVAGVW